MLQAEKTCLLIADISGYTEYLSGVEIDHAQDILADLISTVVTALGPHFRLEKLEGDAAFCSAPTETVDGSIVLDTIERCYFGFRRRRRDVRQATSCECNACSKIPDLNLKFVAHTGLTIRQSIAGNEELLGADVIAVHRLLKNSIVEKMGINAYAALSDKLTTDLELDPASIGMRPHTETYEHIGDMAIWVDDLEARWAVEDSTKRVFVAKEDAIFSMEAEVEAPPEVVWQFVSTPGRRMVWQAPGGITAVEQENPGGRRGVGTVNHCMHGKDAVIEEILDWRPFDYFSDRSTMPGGMNFLSTTEFVPTARGTIVRMNFEPPEDPAQREMFIQMGPIWEQGMKAGLEILKTEAKADAEHILSDRDEPPLPKPKNADGFLEAGLLEGIKPIQYVG
jgi:hypothetical protein